MSLITQWIASRMEDPVHRDQQERERISAAYNRAQKMKAQWDEPTKAEGFWKMDKNKVFYEDNMRVGGKDGKQTRYMATPTSRANSYESVLDMYTKYE